MRREMPLPATVTCSACAYATELHSTSSALLVSPHATDLKASLTAISDQLRSLDGHIRNLATLLHHATQQEKDTLLAHPTCSLCGGLSGPGHVISTLAREPHGRTLVCPDCHRQLTRIGLSAQMRTRQLYEEERRETPRPTNGRTMQ